MPANAAPGRTSPGNWRRSHADSAAGAGAAPGRRPRSCRRRIRPAPAGGTGPAAARRAPRATPAAERLRLRAGARRPRPRRPCRPDGSARPPPHRAAARRPSRVGKVGVRPQGRPPDGSGSSRKARLRAEEQVGGRDRTADRRRLRGGVRPPRLPAAGRGGLASGRPPPGLGRLGDQHGERGPEPARGPRPPLRLHHEPGGTARSGGGAPVPVPRHLPPPRPGAGEPGVDALLRRRSPGRGAGPGPAGAGRLRAGARAGASARVPRRPGPARPGARRPTPGPNPEERDRLPFRSRLRGGPPTRRGCGQSRPDSPAASPTWTIRGRSTPATPT